MSNERMGEEEEEGFRYVRLHEGNCALHEVAVGDAIEVCRVRLDRFGESMIGLCPHGIVFYAGSKVDLRAWVANYTLATRYRVRGEA